MRKDCGLPAEDEHINASVFMCLSALEQALFLIFIGGEYFAQSDGFRRQKAAGR